MLKAQSTIKPLHSSFPHTLAEYDKCSPLIYTLLRKRKLLHEDDVKMLSSRRTQPPVNCLWSMVSSFPGLSINSDNLPFSYVILFLYSLICHYMYENRSWHTYSYALVFLWKNRCDRVVSELYRP
jgi:hypothetical protein